MFPKDLYFGVFWRGLQLLLGHLLVTQHNQYNYIQLSLCLPSIVSIRFKNVERDVKHKIIIMISSSSISLKTTTYIHTSFSSFNAYVLFNKIKLCFFFYFNPPNLRLCPRQVLIFTVRRLP